MKGDSWRHTYRYIHLHAYEFDYQVLTDDMLCRLKISKINNSFAKVKEICNKSTHSSVEYTLAGSYKDTFEPTAARACVAEASPWVPHLVAGVRNFASLEELRPLRNNPKIKILNWLDLSSMKILTIWSTHRWHPLIISRRSLSRISRIYRWRRSR